MLPQPPAVPDIPQADQGRFEIDLRVGGQNHACLIAGWSYAEADYSWAIGNTALISVPLPHPPTDYLMKMRCGPMVSQPTVPFQRVFVEVNGTSIARLICRGATQYELFIPADSLLGANTAEITLRLPDAKSPKSLGDSDDARSLGIWVSSLYLTPVIPVWDAKAILSELQSLGENCELGFVQRALGVEPIGLFRWASTPMQNLLAALDARFEGLGEPENLDVELDEAGEFQVIDNKFGFKNHSWAYQNAGAKHDEVLRRERIRLPFLARLMIDDLQRADRLFCFHDAGQSRVERIGVLVEALATFGPNWLLWVCPATDTAPAATAKRIGPRLIQGYIDAFQPLHNVRQPSIESWLGMVKQAHAIWLAER